MASIFPSKKLLEHTILQLLTQRGPGKTICPSEAARAIAATDEPSLWEPLMAPVRAAGLCLVSEGQIVVTQQGRIVDGATAKGPIRFRLR